MRGRIAPSRSFASTIPACLGPLNRLCPRVHQHHDILHIPQPIADPGRHCRRDFERLVDADEVVPDEVERQDVLDTFEVYTKADPADIAQISRDLLVMGLLPPFEAALESAETIAPSIWKRGWAARGLHIERALGGNLPPGFPVIDRFANGIATSIKSIDLTAASYQNASRLTARLSNYVDRVANFAGDELGSTQIAANEIKGRALHLAIPDGSLTNMQWRVIEAMKVRAKSRGVEILIATF